MATKCLFIVLSVSFFIVFTSAHDIQDGRCPSEWKHLNGSSNSCVRVFDQDKSFDEARKSCQGKAGDLVIISNQAENDFVTSLLGCQKLYWIGLTDEAKEGVFLTVDGNPMGYNKFAGEEPNNLDNFEDCVFTSKVGLWGDLNCEARNPFVCQAAEAEPTSPPETTDDERCPIEWKHLVGTSKSCIRRFDQDKTFDEARKSCRGKGGDLVIISNQAENDFIAKNLDAPYYYWIGLTDSFIEGTFRTVNGQKMAFSRWANGEPNNVYEEDCVQMFKNGFWNDLSCGSEVRYICQIPENEPVECPNNWTPIRGSCVRAFHGNPLNFGQARNFCHQRNSDLVIIGDEIQNKMVTDMLEANKLYWIGASDASVEGQFKLINGKNMRFSHFNSGEPNDYGGSEDCVHTSASGQWNDLNCGQTVNYICQIRRDDSSNNDNNQVLPEVQSDCVDTHRRCEVWARIGRCRRNGQRIRQRCRKSCNLC